MPIMKKFIFVSLAAILAIVFSAFTEAKPVTTTLYYQDDNGIFQTVPETIDVCDPGSSTQCVEEIEGDYRLLWLDNKGMQPYLKAP